jgi:gentisate 1,2-dioxygenase
VAKVGEIDAAGTAKQTPAGAGDTSFVAQLEAANLHPLWDRFKKITPVRPQPRDAPLIWRWKDMRSAKSRSTTWNAARSS